MERSKLTTILLFAGIGLLVLSLILGIIAYSDGYTVESSGGYYVGTYPYRYYVPAKSEVIYYSERYGFFEFYFGEMFDDHGGGFDDTYFAVPFILGILLVPGALIMKRYFD